MKKTEKKRVVGFKVTEDECIWMKAGVISLRLCDNAYDCYNCPFDRGMRQAMNSKSPERAGKKESWVRSLREKYHGSTQPCRHALTGRVDAPKQCVLNYECYHCAYDQMLDEEDFVRQVGKPDYNIVSGFKVADGYYYHMGHSWARFEHGGLVRIGFDDFFAKLFGAVQKIELPPLGAKLKQNDVGWTFDRDGNKAAVLSPVSGTLLTTNYRALEHPEITNEDPYQSGWLFMIEPDLPKRNLKKLYSDTECFQWIEQESRKLMHLVGPEYEEMAATGGAVVNDLYGNLSNLGWSQLVDTFLHTKKM